MRPTCFMSLLSLRIPVRSVLVAPVWPISWMEMAGLVAVDWIGRTDGHKKKTLNQKNRYIYDVHTVGQHLLLTLLCLFLVSTNYIS